MAQATPMNQNAPNRGPRPPRKNPYRDGHSSCPQRYDVFELIRNPYASNDSRPPIAPSLSSDSRFSRQKKIEKEVQIKFEQNLPNLLWNRFVILGKVSKIIFLAIVLPFYLLFYIFPKIIFFKCVPYLAERIRLFVVTTANKIFSSVKRFFYKLLNPFRLLWKILKPSSKDNTKEILDDFKEQETGFFAFIALGLWYLIRPIVKGCYWGVIILKKTGRYLKELPQRCHRAIQKFLTRLKAFPTNLRNKIKDIIVQYVNKAKHQIQRLIFAPIKHRVHNFKAKVGRFFRKLGDTFKSKASLFNRVQTRMINYYLTVCSAWAHVKAVLINFFNKANIQLKSLCVWLKKEKKQSLHVIRRDLKPIFEAALSTPASYVKQVRVQTDIFFKKSYVEMHTVSQNFISCYDKGKEILNLTGQYLSKKLHPFIIRLENLKKLGRKACNKIIKITRPALQHCVSWFKAIAAKWKNTLVRGVAKRIISFILFKMNSFRSNRAASIRPCLQFIKIRWSHFTLQLRITIAWAKVLIVYGMYQVAMITREMGLAV